MFCLTLWNAIVWHLRLRRKESISSVYIDYFFLFELINPSVSWHDWIPSCIDEIWICNWLAFNHCYWWSVSLRRIGNVACLSCLLLLILVVAWIVVALVLIGYEWCFETFRLRVKIKCVHDAHFFECSVLFFDLFHLLYICLPVHSPNLLACIQSLVNEVYWSTGFFCPEFNISSIHWATSLIGFPSWEYVGNRLCCIVHIILCLFNCSLCACITRCYFCQIWLYRTSLLFLKF